MPTIGEAKPLDFKPTTTTTTTTTTTMPPALSLERDPSYSLLSLERGRDEREATSLLSLDSRETVPLTFLTLRTTFCYDLVNQPFLDLYIPGISVVALTLSFIFYGATSFNQPLRALAGIVSW
jgi:hypothetical protein